MKPILDRKSAPGSKFSAYVSTRNIIGKILDWAEAFFVPSKLKKKACISKVLVFYDQRKDSCGKYLGERLGEEKRQRQTEPEPFILFYFIKKIFWVYLFPVNIPSENW